MSLIRALDESDMAGTARILDMSPGEVSSRDSEDRVALHYAAETADADTFQRILEMDSSLIDCQDQNGYTPLLIAAMSGNVPAIKLLIENGSQINHLDKDKHSAVHWAVVCGQLEALMTLLDSGAKVDIADNQGAQAVHYSTASEDTSPERCEAILHVLLKHDAKPNARDIDGRTPILWAASNGNLDAIISLAQAGGDLYAVDRDRLCVMHCAASHGHEHVIEYLLNSLDPSIVNSMDRNGDTPLFYAVTLGHYDCARLLLHNGANANHQDHYLRSPSHCAAAKGQLRMLKLLKHFGGSFEIQNGRGDLPIHEAIQAGAKDCVEYLLTLHPSSVDATNHEGRTGLHLAAASGNTEMVILLCTRNAVINPLMLYKDTFFTPLDLAKRKKHDLVIDYLRLRQNAKLAEELPEETKKEMKSHLEHQTVEGLRGNQKDACSGILNSSVNSVAVNSTTNIGKIESTNQETQTSSPNCRAAATNTSRPVTGINLITQQPITLTVPQICLPKATSTADLERYLLLVEKPKTKQISEVRQRDAKMQESVNNDCTNGNQWTSDEEQDDEEESKNKRQSIRVISSKSKKKSDQKSMKVEAKCKRDKMKKKDAERVDSNEDWSDDMRKKDDENTDLENGVYTDDSDSQSAISATVEEHRKRNPSKKVLKHSQNDDLQRKTEKTVGLQRIDIYQNEEVEVFPVVQQGASRKYKKIGECYAHEQAIFEELTHLKKMQLQYGKVKEPVLVRTLINNFCKMHGLNPAHFKFQTFNSWEKFLHDQLKLLYLEERYRIMGSRNLSYSSSSKFQTRLERARAVPLNTRLDELAHAYRGTTKRTTAEGSRSAQSDLSRKKQHTGEKRCNCLYEKT